MAQTILPGDIDIKRCILKSLDGKRQANFIAQVAFIDLFEAITQPLITGDIVIRDGIGLLRSFPIIGEEQVEIEFETPTLGRRSYVLNVERVGSIVVDETKKSLTYTLRVVSPEQFTNATTIVSQRFVGNVSQSISTILADFLATPKPTAISPTVGIDDQLITNISPLEAIDKLRHRAISGEFSSSSFVFFEDVRGFHFLTIEQMLKRAKSPVAKFFYDDVVTTDVTQSKFRDMINFYQAQTQATTERLRAGAINGAVKKYNMITGGVEDVVFTEADSAEQFQKTGRYARENTSTFINNYDRPSIKTILPWTPGKDLEEIADKHGKLVSFVTQVMQNVCHANIYGDSNLNLGDCIECCFVNGHGLTSTNKATVTNRYTISKIRHSILNSNRPVYTQALEVINNSFDQ